MEITLELTVMAESFTLTLTGSSSVLEANYFPPIELSQEKNYVLGLVELLTFNSIPNIDVGGNKFYVTYPPYEAINKKNYDSNNVDGGIKVIKKNIKRAKRNASIISMIDDVDVPEVTEIKSKPKTTAITLPTGSYEIEDIETYIRKALPKLSINLKANNNELKSEIKCDQFIDFEPEDSIGRLLGFTDRQLEPNKTHSSNLPVAILKLNVLRVECNITSNAYINDRRVHTIHEFFPSVPPGFKIVEVPSHVIYLPILTKAIHNIRLRIVDQDGNLVNFRGETITIRLHVKSL